VQSALIRSIQNQGYFFLEGREIGNNSFPNGCQIDAEILMDQFVPHAGNIFPGNIGVSFLYILGKVLRRLADNLELANDPILDQPLSQKGIIIESGHILLILADCVQDMAKIYGIILDH